MKRILFALLCVASTGTAWAQSPTPTQGVLPAYPVYQMQSGAIQQVSGGKVFGGSGCCVPNCAPACGVPACQPTKTICVPEPSVTIHKKITYSSICERVCFPKCPPLGGGKCCDSGCGQGNCESHSYQKKYLVKHVCITECPSTTCVAVTVPACNTGCAGAACAQPSSGVIAPPVVVTPPMPPARK
jgi:hypothetical protein